MSEENVSFSLQDLAYAIDDDLDSMSDEGRTALVAYLRNDPRPSEQIAEVLAIARDCEMEGYPSGALQVHACLESLLAENCWDPAYQLLKGDEEDHWYRILCNYLKVRLERAEDPSGLQAIKRRLEDAHLAIRLGRDALRVVVEHLGRLDRNTAEVMLRQLVGSVLRRKKELAEATGAET